MRGLIYFTTLYQHVKTDLAMSLLRQHEASHGSRHGSVLRVRIDFNPMRYDADWLLALRATPPPPGRIYAEGDYAWVARRRDAELLSHVGDIIARRSHHILRDAHDGAPPLLSWAAAGGSDWAFACSVFGHAMVWPSWLRPSSRNLSAIRAVLAANLTDPLSRTAAGSAPASAPAGRPMLARDSRFRNGTRYGGLYGLGNPQVALGLVFFARDAFALPRPLQPQCMQRAQSADGLSPPALKPVEHQHLPSLEARRALLC